jgi:glycine cleavage system pyridoxal-binding protein P
MFTPHTDADREAMLRAIGVDQLADLFQVVPAKHRFPQLDLPPALSEMEAAAELQDLAWANESTRDLTCFLGAGVYNHYIPPSWTICYGAASSTRHIHPINLKFHKARCKPSSNINR